MARPDPALPLRVPAAERRAPEVREEGRPRLRLVVTKGRLGVELEQPVELGPVRVTGLSQAFPRVGFPVDLSQGTVAFRNRRGVLEQLSVAMDTAAMVRRVRKACADLLAPGKPEQVLVAPLSDGFTVGVGSAERALCFDVVVAPLGADLRLLVTDARCLGVDEPAHMLALQVLLRACKPLGRASGGVVLLERVPRVVVRALMPMVGMRVPAVTDLRWGELSIGVDGALLGGSVEAASMPLSERSVRLLELAELCVEGDAALLAGDREGARRGYLGALSQAPRHPELSYRLADLDRAVGERQEAALVTLSDATAAMDSGVLGAGLLQAVGDRQGASYAWRRAAEREPFGWLAALCWLRLSELSEADASAAMDEALARAPAMAAARWRRMRAQLRAGKLVQARADVQHLEAAASAGERFEVLRRAGVLFHEERALQDAMSCFERALRYRPASVAAVAGLAQVLQAMGQGKRALDLYARAVQLADRGRQVEHAVVLQLARALVEVADDRPAAIARVRTIPALVAETFEARALEARWRADLGDLAGAGVALDGLARAVDAAVGVLIEGAAEGPFSHAWTAQPSHAAHERRSSRDQARAHIGRLLLEGSRLHELDRGDALGARRLLTLAVRVWPRSPAVQRAFRRLARQSPDMVLFEDDARAEQPVQTPRSPELADAAEEVAEPEPLPGTAPAVAPAHQVAARQAAAQEVATSSAEPSPGTAPAVAPAPEAAAPSVVHEQLAEQLATQLRADPSNRALARRLMDVLGLLGRDHELLALIAARLEEADEDERPILRRRRRTVLARLASSATAAGRLNEASVYDELLAQDPVSQPVEPSEPS